MGSRYAVVFGASLTQFTIIGLYISSGLFFKVFEAEFAGRALCCPQPRRSASS